MNQLIDEQMPSRSKEINYKTHRLINYFVFFLAFTALSEPGNSVTFYIFIAIVYRIGIFWKSSYTGKVLLSLFLGVLFISNLTAPYSIMPGHSGVGHIPTLGVQYVYWILVAAFFSKYTDRLNLFVLGKYLFFQTLLISICFCLDNLISFLFDNPTKRSTLEN